MAVRVTAARQVVSDTGSCTNAWPVDRLSESPGVCYMALGAMHACHMPAASAGRYSGDCRHSQACRALHGQHGEVWILVLVHNHHRLARRAPLSHPRGVPSQWQAVETSYL